MESLVCLLLDSYFVRVIGVCHVIPHGVSHIDSSRFAQHVEILKQYLSVVLESLPNVFCWLHKAFSHPAKDLYLADGVHVNPAGQYHLYRSYRGAIFQALKMLWIFVTSARVFYPFLSSSPYKFPINSSVCCFVDSSTKIFILWGFVLLLWIRSFVVWWIPPRQLFVERFRPLVMDSSICFVVDSSTQFFIWEDSSSCYGFVHFLFCGFVHKNFIFEEIRPLLMDSSISCMWIRPLLCTFLFGIKGGFLRRLIVWQAFPASL